MHHALSGGLAQLGEHLLCKQGVVGSIPSSSTKHQGCAAKRSAVAASTGIGFHIQALATGECFDVDTLSTNAAGANLLQRLFFKNS